MAWGTNDTRLKLTPEEEAKLVGLDHYEMIQYMHDLEVARGYRAPAAVEIGGNVVTGTVLHEVAPVETKQADAEIKQVTINGQVVRGTQTEIDAAMRAAFTAQQQQEDAPARDTNGRFKKETQPQKTDAEAVPERAELDLQFKRGQIDTAEYLEKTGAIAEALEKQLGVPISAIAETFQEQAGKIYERSWQEASAEFLKSSEGRTWPGGTANKEKLGEVMKTTKLDGVPLTDLPDKVQALRLAYDHMKENDLLVANTEAKQAEEHALQQRIAAAKSPEEIQEILGVNARRVAARQSALWGK